jgi:hypothetical protein
MLGVNHIGVTEAGVLKLPRKVLLAVASAFALFSATSATLAQQERSRETEVLAIGQQSEIRFAAPWTPSTVQYSNAQELVVIRREPSEHAVARVLITTEPRINYPDALKRLGAIAASRDELAQFVEIGGWPAVEVKFTEPLPRRDAKGEEGAGTLSPEVLAQRAIIAIAADDKVVRFDVSVLPDAPQELLEGAQHLVRSAHFAKQGNPAEVQKTLRRMQEEEEERQSQLKQRRGAVPEEGPKTTIAAVTPQAGPPVAVHPGFGELEISASPDANNIVIAGNSGLLFSTDRGAHFATGSSGVFGLNDATLARAQSGNFYLGVIAFPNALPGQLNVTGCTNAVSRSNNNGASFALQGYSARCPLTGAGLCFPDQPHIAADTVNTASGNDQLYAVWRNFTTTNPIPSCTALDVGFATTLISCSQDNGVNWAAPAQIAGDFPRVAVGRDGAVYVVTLSGNSVLLNRFTSCASGLTLEAGFPVTVATFFGPVSCPVPGLDRCNFSLSNPTVAPDPDDANHLFVAFAEFQAVNDERIVAVESGDRGLSIKFPGRLIVSNTPSARRFMPWSCSTHGRAWVGWYDRRAATGTNNDLTDYFVGSTRSTILMNLSNNPDPQCASGWPCGTRNPRDSEFCSVQPQLAGSCKRAGGGSGTRCDFSGPDATMCPTGETCQTGSGCPKYGDYNGIACANNFVIAAWSSATPPRGVTAPSPGINIYAAVIDVTSKTQLTVFKMLEHPDHNHLRLFNLQIDGVTVRANVNSGSTGPQLVTPGSHRVGETGGTGTPLSVFTTVIGGDCAADGTVNLAEGDSKTCTVTNFDHAGGCAFGSRCCEPGDDTQGCQRCVVNTRECP